MDPDWVDVFPIGNGDIPASYVRIPTGRLPKPSLSAFCWLKLRWDHGSGEWSPFFCGGKVDVPIPILKIPKTHIGLENRQKNHPTKKVVSQPPFSRDPGSPKLRMVSWNLNTLAFWKRLDTPTGHVWAILAGPHAACISLSSFHTEKNTHTHTHTHTHARTHTHTHTI